MKNLVISVHPDDEILSCTSVLDEDAFVYFCGIDNRERLKEVDLVAQLLGYQYQVNFSSKINYYDIADFAPPLETVINGEQPERIFIPHPGTHQDHVAIYYACLVALRPHDTNYFVPNVLVYEGIHDLYWSEHVFKPNYYIGVDINRKIAAYSLYVSQLREHRSIESVKHMAALRGGACKKPYAEAFSLLRGVL